MSNSRFPNLPTDWPSVQQQPVELDMSAIARILGQAPAPSAWAPEMRHGFGEPAEPVWPELIANALLAPPPPPMSGLAQYLADATAPNLSALSPNPAPFGLFGSSRLGNALTQHAFGLGDYDASWPTETAQQKAKREARSTWNGRFALWEKNVSLSEEGMLDRASQMVQAAIRGNIWLSQIGVCIAPQGSWYNATNIRKDSDVDLRVMLPLVKVDYAPNVFVSAQHFAQTYTPGAWTLEDLFPAARRQLAACLEAKFGKANVEAGGKAFAVAGVLGSRAKVDVVPAVPLHYVWADETGQLHTLVGVAILGTDGTWTYNFPDQHHHNGKAKRDRTSRQFKKVVRIFKNLRGLLKDQGFYVGPAPSFMVECLVYLVEDGWFTEPATDRYVRVRRIALRLQALLRAPGATLYEISDFKLLFAYGQAWTYLDAVNYVDAVVALLGDL